MRPMFRRQALSIFAVLALLSSAASGQFRPDGNGFIRVSLDDVKWSGGNAMESVVVAGDPSKPGIYVIRNRFPPGVMSRPHFHNQDRYVTVIKGTWWTAVGADGGIY